MDKSTVVKILDGDDIKKELVFNTDINSKIDSLVRFYFPNFKKIIDWELKYITFIDVNKVLSLKEMEEKLNQLVGETLFEIKDIKSKLKNLGFNKTKIDMDTLSRNNYVGKIIHNKNEYSYRVFIDEQSKIKKFNVMYKIFV